MAGTAQLVSWAIEKECPLRVGPAVAEIDAATEAVRQAATYGRYLSQGRDTKYCFGIYGDVCVTGAMAPFLEMPARVPYHGFVTSKAFATVGGAEGLRGLCGSCPANALGHPGGCVGSFYKRPDFATHEQLQSIIQRLGLAGEVEQLFPATTPLWYGLWTKSPLSPAAAGVLEKVFRQLWAEDHAAIEAGDGDWYRQTHLRDLQGFVAATQAAMENGVSLHVKMLPPGHTDFGVYTVFPHCPFCKAGAEIEPWQTHYPTALYTCHACGTRYSPRDNSYRQPMSMDREDLRAALGQEAYEVFVVECLVANGHSMGEAQTILQQHLADEARRIAMQTELERQRQLEDQYRDECVYAGLPVIHLQSEDGEDDGIRVFGRADFEVVLSRCKNLGLPIIGMGHHSRREELEKTEYGETDYEEMFAHEVQDPRALFAAWVAEGCDESFWAEIRVPEKALAEWQRQKGDH